MRELLHAMLERLQQGKAVALASVIASSGSVPRGPGATMLSDESGYAFGTVGGGTVEGQALALSAQVLQQGGCLARDFALRNREAADLGMVCGGDMKLLFLRIDPELAPLCREALSRIARGQAGYFVIDIKTGRIRLEQDRPADDHSFAQPLLAEGCAYVFGAGHVAQALTPILTHADFRVVVVDDRPEFANAERFPQAGAVWVMDFTKAEGIPITPKDDIVIMTRGHEHDLNVLSQMLRTPARYIGMMGSRSKRSFVYHSLRAQGFSQTDIDRVHSPIGLSIGAETPWEIAISIAAELIQTRAQSKRHAPQNPVFNPQIP